MNRANTPNLDSWNPMQEDYEDREFNSYAGRSLYENLSKLGMQQQKPRNVPHSHDIFALHVKRIPLTMSETGLRNLFNKSGVVLDVKVLSPTGMHNPAYLYGKVYFSSPQEAIKGLQALHDTPPLYLQVELDRHDFRMNGSQQETPRLPASIQNYAGNSCRVMPDDRISGGRGLLPTPNFHVQGQAETTSRTVYTHQNYPMNKDATITQGHTGSQSATPAYVKDTRCVKCQSKGSKCCTRCKTIYCSVACQRADWEQHKFVCLSLKAETVSRPYILEDPPLPKQSPTSISHKGNSPNQPKGSFFPDHRGEPLLPVQAFDQPTGQHTPAGDRQFQPRPNFGKQNNQQKGDSRDQHRSASQATSDRKYQQKPYVDHNTSGQHHQPEAGKQNLQKADNVEDNQHKGNYHPLRRPNPPQTSAPKSNRPITPHKLRTIIPVTIGTLTKVKIAHIVDPSNFYLHLDKEDDLAEIMRKVQVVDQDSPPVEVALGQIVAAKFSLDGVWYRARVEKAEKDKIYVNFIDYGNIDSVTMQDLRKLNPEIAELPVQAVWCRLTNVQPTKGQWSTDAVRCFKVITENIELLATREKTCGDQSWITMKEDSVGDAGELLVTTGLATKSLPVHGSCLENWEIGAKITLATPTLEKVGKIWASHMAGIPTDQVAVLFSELGEACRSLGDAINSECFTVGTVVAAQSPSDEVWYRGVVLKIGTNEFLVRYLDFGNCETVFNIRLLPAAFCQYLTLGICFRVEEPYSCECVPDEFLPDDALTVTVLRLMGDTATVSVEFGDGSPTIQARASSVWKSCDGFDFSETSMKDVESQVAAAAARLQLEDVSSAEPQQTIKPSHFVTPTKNDQTPYSVKPFSPSIIGKGLELLPKLEIPFNPVAVIPAWIESLDRISVQFLEVDKIAILHKLSEELQEACQDGVLGTLTKLPAVGQLVCGQFSLDGMWNRCLVEEVHADGRILVRFIDYGNAEVTSLDNLKPLPNSFYNTCPMALTVSIGTVTTVTLESLKEALMPSAAEVVPLIMTVKDRNANPVHVTLATDDGRSLEDFLPELSAPHYLENEEVEVPAQHVETVEAPEPQVIIERKEESAPQAVIEQVEVAQSTEESVAATESQELNFEPVTTPSFVQLEVGQILDLCIGGVYTPELIMVMKFDSEEFSSYDKMAEDITECCSKGATVGYRPKEGDFCLAKSKAFEQWYRALITDVEDDNCNVLFPDYGNSEVVEMRDIRPMVEEFRNKQFQAVYCSILGVGPKEDGYSAEESEKFKTFLTSQEFINAEVVQKQSDDLYVIRVPSIEAELKKLGFLLE